MRKLIIAGNWKMYKSKDEAVDFIYEINESIPSKESVDSIIFAPFIYLRSLVKRQGDNLRIGAQNMHYLDEGAYTGEISAPMLKQIGVTYVLIGHSERRQYYAENDETVNLKIKQALRNNLIPMVCIGEPLEQREEGTTEHYLHEQIVNGLNMLTSEDVKKIIIAYEPIWAIGTGRTASSIQANETIGFIRSELVKLFDKETSEEVPILYGGSVNLKNAEELLKCSQIDGALIGGASLKAQSLLEIITIAKNITK